MPYYRIYGLDDAGRITSVVEAEHDREQQAPQHAATLGHLHGVDVWEGARCVGHIEPVHSRHRD